MFGGKLEYPFNDPECTRYTESTAKGIKPDDVRSFNVGESDYSSHGIQPWDIWIEYGLNPFDADIVKRILRTKVQQGKSAVQSRIEDYEKIVHVCRERIRQLNEGIDSWGEFK